MRKIQIKVVRFISYDFYIKFPALLSEIKSKVRLFTNEKYDWLRKVSQILKAKSLDLLTIYHVIKLFPFALVASVWWQKTLLLGNLFNIMW